MLELEAGVPDFYFHEFIHRGRLASKRGSVRVEGNVFRMQAVITWILAIMETGPESVYPGRRD